MHIRAPAIVLAARQHGETAVIARFLTEQEGMVAGYVAGGRGRQLRPVVMPGNLVEVDLRSRSDSQLPFAKVELVDSRGPWLNEPLPAAAIVWACALTATALPERHAYPRLWQALGALLSAICHAPSARGWAQALIGYETLLLREMGYGGVSPPQAGDMPEILAAMDRLSGTFDRYLLADPRGDVMGARSRLRELLGRME